jgi:hypothetical protein
VPRRSGERATRGCGDEDRLRCTRH